MKNRRFESNICLQKIDPAKTAVKNMLLYSLIVNFTDQIVFSLPLYCLFIIFLIRRLQLLVQ